KDYTFFETLNDSEMKKIVGLNNKVQDEPRIPPPHLENKEIKKEVKPESAQAATPPQHSDPRSASPAPVRSEENKTQKQPALTGALNENTKKQGAEMKAQSLIKPHVSEVVAEKDDDKTYTVQISSFKELARAQGLQSQLQKKGYPAYLLTVDSSGQGGLVYRVFLGKYIGQNKAKEAANKVKREDKVNAVVVLLTE
ncbi:MAG: hypothetical protein A3K09_00050, partial [Nitrospinae bacterium RIFCSPLOWO2_12_FULL_47_7]